LVTAIGDGTAKSRAAGAPQPLPSDRRSAFEQLYQAEYEAMLRLAVLLVRSRELAEEAVHDAFAKVYERWSKLTNPGGYLRTCVVNRCRDLGRRRRLERGRRVTNEQHSELESFELVDALARVPMDRRVALVLRFYDGLSEQETAAVLGVPVGTVKSRVSRGLAQLREEVTP
jgi:RNA polymerase sigma-70 factor (sigma-E family)